jgi:hypothetical protein
MGYVCRDRSIEAGPIERRKNTLGMILTLMGSGEYHQCRDTAGELMWEICGGDGMFPALPTKGDLYTNTVCL